MKKQEKQLEMEVNGIPDLSKAPKDLLQLFLRLCWKRFKQQIKKESQQTEKGLIQLLCRLRYSFGKLPVYFLNVREK